MRVDPGSGWFSDGYYRVFYLPETDSTNTRMKAWAAGECPLPEKTDLKDFDILAAGEQTAGRGRLGRRFVSPGSGLYFSVLIPQADPERAAGLTPVCAAAMARAAGDMGVSGVGIKWVNDLYLRGRKVAGILCEYVPRGIVCGIGVNITEPEGGFPPGAGPAGALSDRPLCPEALLSLFMRSLRRMLEDPAGTWDFYRGRMLLRGRRVVCRRGSSLYCGTAEDVAPDYALLVRLDDGTLVRLSSGEVIHVSLEEDGHAGGVL